MPTRSASQGGFYFWEDYVDANEPYFKWPFNGPDYNLFPVLNLAVGGSGGGDPASATTRPRCWPTGCGSSG
jgi:hypothetical protein